MKIQESKDNITVTGLKDFNLKHIFECGQCFRWYKNDNNSYTGVAGDYYITLSYENNILEIQNCTKKQFLDFWYNYFDLDRDYEDVMRKIAKDDIMKKAIDFGYGIRILNQEYYETLFSFILSANNRIPMIKKTIKAYSEKYGQQIQTNSSGGLQYSFPTKDTLRTIPSNILRQNGGGFRCKYINTTANMLNESYAPETLKELSTDIARRRLTELSGVGDKVADCTLLFSGIKQDVFPTDVWVKRVMEELYLKKESTFKEIQEFAQNYWGEYAGFAQQYLFYYARENRIGT